MKAFLIQLPVIIFFSILTWKGTNYILGFNATYFYVFLYTIIYCLPVFLMFLFVDRRNKGIRYLSVISLLLFYLKSELMAILLVMVSILGFLAITDDLINNWLLVSMFITVQIPASVIFYKDIKLIIKPLNQKK